MKGFLLIAAAIIIVIFAAGCCGIIQPECPESCDDGNVCTKDTCSEGTNYECVHQKIQNCGVQANASNALTPGAWVSGHVASKKNQTAQPSAVTPGAFLSTEEGTNGTAGEISSDEKTADWTILVYMGADTNLEAAGIADMNEMEMAGSTDNVNIIVQMDRSPLYDPYDGYDSSNGNWYGAKRYYVTKDLDKELIGSRELENMGETDMGSQKVLEDFLLWGVKSYPADHYMVVIWDHGAGWDRMASGSEQDGMVVFDETSDDALSMKDVTGALSKLNKTLGKKVDIIAFDACLMAMYEVDYEMARYADVRISSEEYVPGDGFDYDASLNALVKNPSMDGKRLASQFVDDYSKYYTGDKAEDTITISAVDLDKSDAFSMAIDTFAKTMAERMTDKTAAEIGRVRYNVEEYGSRKYGSIDLVDFAMLVTQTVSDPEITAAAQGVVDAYQGPLLSEKHGTAHPNSYGYSVYFPYSKERYATNYSDYASFSTERSWDKFLKEYYGMQSADMNGPKIKKMEVSQDVASPTSPAEITAVVSGYKIQDIDFIVYMQGTGDSENYIYMMDYLVYSPPEQTLEDGSTITKWNDGENFLNIEWNTNARIIVGDESSAYATLQPLERGSTYYFVNGEYTSVGSITPLYASLVFNMDTTELTSIWDYTSAKEIIPNKGDKFTPYISVINLDDDQEYTVGSGDIIYGDSGFTLDYSPLPEGTYYLSLYADDTAGNSDSKYVTVDVAGYTATGGECSDGTPNGYCSATYPGYYCENGEWLQSEQCYAGVACIDGTAENQCSMVYNGYRCTQAELVEDNECKIAGVCVDWTYEGECSAVYNGYECVNSVLEYNDMCYDPSHSDDCSDGTLNGYCSTESPGHYCNYGELSWSESCQNSCSDGTQDGYCSAVSEGYWCTNGGLEQNDYCLPEYGGEQSCDDGTEHGYCSSAHNGYWCNNGDYEYDASCMQEQGGACSDGTLHAECSTANPGYGCWDGELYQYEECGAEISYDCSDGTVNGYCSTESPGYYCSYGELTPDETCQGSCQDGTSDGYCSYTQSGYWCNNGVIEENSYCSENTYCSDGTEHGYCSSVTSGYGCWNGELYQYDECGTATSDVCSDGTANATCSTQNPGEYCWNGELYLQDYCSGSCSDGTPDGYCSEVREGYWCNSGKIEYSSYCLPEGNACSDKTASGECSATNPGYYCWNGELSYEKECSPLGTGSRCMDNTLNLSCSTKYPGYVCYDNELLYYDACADACADGTMRGYCSAAAPGFWCTDAGAFEKNAYCLPGTCDDGTKNATCSTAYPGYVCYNGQFVEYQQCSEQVQVNCEDGSYDGSCSKRYPSYRCTDGRYVYDYGCASANTQGKSCADGTPSGECTGTGYICYNGKYSQVPECLTG